MIPYSISIVVPMYNEQGNALRVIQSLDHKLKKLTNKYEIIIVESGSTDNTKAVVDELAQQYKRCRVFHQDKKEGLGSALRYGFRESRNDLVLYMDGDEPFSADEIQRAVPIIKDADAVIGFRVGSRESFSRWFYSKGYNGMIRTLFGIRAKDVNFSFKMLTRKAIDALDLRSNGFFIDAEMLAELKRNKLRVKEMPVTYTPRKEGSSSVSIGPRLIGNMLKEMVHYMLRKKNTMPFSRNTQDPHL